MTLQSNVIIIITVMIERKQKGSCGFMVKSAAMLLTHIGNVAKSQTFFFPTQWTIYHDDQKCSAKRRHLSSCEFMPRKNTHATKARNKFPPLNIVLSRSREAVCPMHDGVYWPVSDPIGCALISVMHCVIYLVDNIVLLKPLCSD